jgi:signal transduction histidine kinase
MGIAVDAIARASLIGGVDKTLQANGLEVLRAHRAIMQSVRSGVRHPTFPTPSADPLSTLRARFFRVNAQIPLPPNREEEPYSLVALSEARLGRATVDTVWIEGIPVRIYSQPLSTHGIVDAVVQIPFDLRETYRAIDSLRQVLLWMIPVGVGVSVLGSIVLVERLLHPLRHLIDRAEKIEGSDLDERLPVRGRDEFAKLGETLNKMLGRLQTALRRERETSRRLEVSLEQQRRFSADASHEIRTPIAVVKANARVIRFGPLSEEQNEALCSIEGASDRMARLVQDLLMLARSESGLSSRVPQPCLLAEVVERIVVSGDGTYPLVEIQVMDHSYTVHGHFDDLVRMVQNLVDNAVRHSGATRIDVVARYGEIEVRDNGVGIDPIHHSQLFHRFYRVDASRDASSGGTGLGLAIVKGVAEAHGGVVELESSPGRGSCFRVRFTFPAHLAR